MWVQKAWSYRSVSVAGVKMVLQMSAYKVGKHVTYDVIFATVRVQPFWKLYPYAVSLYSFFLHNVDTVTYNDVTTRVPPPWLNPFKTNGMFHKVLYS